MMATLDSLVDDVIPMIVADVPEKAIRDAILWSARDFLRKTRWLRETILLIAVEDQDKYTLISEETDCEPFAVQAAQLGDEYLTPATQEEVQPGSRGWYFFEPPADVILSWTPDSSDDGLRLRVRAILGLLPTAATVPDAVLTRWNSAISYGALSRLFLMARSPWFDKDLGAYYSKMWLDDLSMARAEAEHQGKAYAFGSAGAA